MAAFAVVAQGRSTRKQLGIQNMWPLIDRWESDESKAARVETAKKMLADWDNRQQLPDEALHLLGTFELLAYLVIRSKTFSVEDAWINFSSDAIQWWYVFRPGIEAFRAGDPTLYEDYSVLVEKLLKLEDERRAQTREELTPSDEDLKDFLRQYASDEPPGE